MADAMPIKPRLWKNKADFFRPFRASSATRNDVERSVLLYDSDNEDGRLDDGPGLEDMNTALEVLVDLFPNVEPEVFRQMLPKVSAESRAQIIADTILSRKKGQDVRERQPSARRLVQDKSGHLRQSDLLRDEDKLQSQKYHKAVQNLLAQEFKSLSRSTVRGVLAEHNHSYTLARPILQAVSTKSWRFTLTNFWKRTPANTIASEHPSLVWQQNTISGAPSTPHVKCTGSLRLDRELHKLFVRPVLTRQRLELLAADYHYASKVNEAEADASDALFECACCYDTVPFERLTVCDNECHQLCYTCVQRTVKEAVYGQGWNKTIDIQKGTLRCFSASDSGCDGSVSAVVVQQALTVGEESTSDIWRDFQTRLVSDSVLQSQLPLQRCPFCEYAEAAEVPVLQFKSAKNALYCTYRRGGIRTKLSLATAAFSVTFLTIPFLFTTVFASATLYCILKPLGLFDASWKRVNQCRQTPRFQCMRLQCGVQSCTRCSGIWRDPHVCFENESTSLRTTLEASATAAVKRTCPRCFLSFVRASGCNKMVCNCGYTMCYICREEITPEVGYAHFCQHFRPQGGRCIECDRCDLYGEEDEAEAIETAVRLAEAEWLDKVGRDRDGRNAAQLVNALVEKVPKLAWHQVWLDAVIDIVAR